MSSSVIGILPFVRRASKKFAGRKAGHFCRPVDADDLPDIDRVLCVTEAFQPPFEAILLRFEGMCVRFATYRMTPLELSHLIELHEASLAMVEANNVDACDAFNSEFHGCIYRATPNSFLAEQAQDVRSRLIAFRHSVAPGRSHSQVSG
jgi:DNA-binding FadR family transcriptional regulator